MPALLRQGGAWATPSTRLPGILGQNARDQQLLSASDSMQSRQSAAALRTRCKDGQRDGRVASEAMDLAGLPSEVRLERNHLSALHIVGLDSLDMSRLLNLLVT